MKSTRKKKKRVLLRTPRGMANAKRELANVVPTTFAGIFALSQHMEELYSGALALPENPKNWNSTPERITFADEEMLSKFNGEPIELSLPFWILRNVASALQKLAVQS